MFQVLLTYATTVTLITVYKKYGKQKTLTRVFSPDIGETQNIGNKYFSNLLFLGFEVLVTLRKLLRLLSVLDSFGIGGQSIDTKEACGQKVLLYCAFARKTTVTDKPSQKTLLPRFVLSTKFTFTTNKTKFIILPSDLVFISSPGSLILTLIYVVPG